MGTLPTLEKWAKALDFEPYRLFFTGDGRPKPPKVRERKRLGQQGERLLKLFSQLDRSDRGMVLFTAQKLVSLQRQV